MKQLINNFHQTLYEKSRLLLFFAVLITVFSLIARQALDNHSQKREIWLLNLISGAGLVTSGHLIEINRFKFSIPSIETQTSNHFSSNRSAPTKKNTKNINFKTLSIIFGVFTWVVMGVILDNPRIFELQINRIKNGEDPGIEKLRD